MIVNHQWEPGKQGGDMGFNNLKMGVKLGVGFGIVGILFIIVVFQYQRTLTGTTNAFKNLLHTNE